MRNHQDTVAHVASFQSPHDLWRELVGEHPAPGAWPPAPEEDYVPERWQIGGFEADDLRALVRRKAKHHSV